MDFAVAMVGTTGTARPKPKHGRGWRVALFVLAALVVMLARPAVHHARAASLLVAFQDPSVTPAVVEEAADVTVGAGRVVPGRLYRPAHAGPDAPGVVIVHGVHRLG